MTTPAYRNRFDRGPAPRAPELYVTDEITGTLRLRDEVAAADNKPADQVCGGPDDVSASQLSETLRYLSDAAAMIVDRLDALVELSEIIANQHVSDNEGNNAKRSTQPNP